MEKQEEKVRHHHGWNDEFTNNCQQHALAAMPRAKAKASQEEATQPFKFTTVPPPIGYLNAKNISATYAKSDSQTFWSRRDEWDKRVTERKQIESNAMMEEKNTNPTKPINNNEAQQQTEETMDDDEDEEGRTSEQEDPSSKVLVILPGSRWLRIGRASDVLPVAVPNVIARRIKEDDESMDQDTPVLSQRTADTVLDSKLEALRSDYKKRMRDLKLRGTTNGTGLAAAYNETVKPEVMLPHDDPYAIEWIEPSGGEDVYVGNDALRIPDRPGNGYSLRWPISSGTLNVHGDYKSIGELLGDIQKIWEEVLQQELGINPRDLPKYSAILIIPDLYDQVYIREMANMMLRTIGFRQITMQQESLCAAFGAGVSSACVVNIGAEHTTVACLDEGMILADTRMKLWFGGDDMNEILLQLLLKVNFPYSELNMSIRHDRDAIEKLKEEISTLGESTVGLNLYTFIVRSPNKPTAKYAVRTYDEVILAPMCLFATRVIDFDRKLKGRQESSIPENEIDEIVDFEANIITGAMKRSTQHLIPSEPQQLPVNEAAPTEEASENATNASPRQTPALEDAANTNTYSSQPGTPSHTGDTKPPTRASSPTAPALVKNTTNTKNNTNAPAPVPGIDIRYESSKIPLDAAILYSVTSAGNEERVKRILSSMLLIGGGSRIPWAGWAVQSRLSVELPKYYATPPPVNVVPPPREVDACDLAWKGVSVLGKLEAANDLWVRPSDYDMLGIRAIKDRCFYFAS